MPGTELKMEFDEPLRGCPLCDSADIRYYDQDFAGRKLSLCRDCGTKFMNPQYSAAYLATFYAQYIGVDPQRDPVRLQRRTISKTDDLAFISRHSQPGRLLSVGCGDGLELELAARAGWEAEGYDVDPETTRQVGERLGTTIHTGDFFDLELPADRYDCVFMDQVLEHPKNPQEYLREMHRILRPGGVLFIGCPNTFTISSVAQTLYGRLGLKRRRGRHYGMFHHLFLYNPWQLRRVLEKHYGFEVIAAEGDPLCGDGARKVAGTWLDAPAAWIGRNFPFVEGTFRLLARKEATSSVAELKVARAA